MASRRSVYEGMSRGDLIAALCKLDEVAVERTQLEQRERECESLQHIVANLHATVHRHRRAFDEIPVALCVFDETGSFVEANRAAATLLRYNQARIIGARLPAIVTVRERPVLEEHFLRCMSDPGPITSTLTMQLGQREAIVQITSAPTQRDGQPRYPSVLHDLTALAMAKRRATARAELTESLLAAPKTSDVLEATREHVIPEAADVLYVELRGDARPYVAGGDEATQSALRAAPQSDVWETFVEKMIREQSPVFDPRSCEALRERGVRVDGTGLVLLPLVAPKRPLGVFGLMMTSSKRPYHIDDLDLAMHASRAVAVAIERAGDAP